MDRDLEEEIRLHLELESERNRRAGMSDAEAYRAARLAFGGVDKVSELHRDARGTRVIEDAFADVRYAARTLARAPAFVAVSIVTLTIAITVGTSLFTAVNGFFYRPLPVPGGKRLIAIFTSDNSGMSRGGTSYADLESFARETGPVAELAGAARVTLGIGVDDNVALLPGALVSPGYFRMLRLTPALGRFPVAASADHRGIVLGYALWRRTFAADPSLIGRAIRVNGHFFTVEAIAPPEFLGTNRELAEEFWIDAHSTNQVLSPDGLLTHRGDRRFRPLARLRDGASPDAFQARLDVVAARLVRDQPDTWRDTTGQGLRVTTMLERDAFLASVGSSDLLLVIGGVISLGLGLLALASTNLASMQMARTAVRRREIATRLALGARRGRLVRQLLAESALIAVPAVIVGLLLTQAVSVIVMRYRPPGLPFLDMSLDARALIFTSGGMSLALLIFGLMPALQGVRGDLLTDLKRGQTGNAGARVGRVRGGLIVAQVALGLTFSATAALVALALARHARDSRVDGNRILVSSVSLLPEAGDSARVAVLLRELVEAIESVPGVEAASATRFIPIPGDRTTVRIELHDIEPVRSLVVDVNQARPGYFPAIGLPLLQGRDFTEGDMIGRRRVAIVSSAMAEALWPGASPMGRQLTIGTTEKDPVEVIGVAGELRDNVRPIGSSPPGMLYLPLRPGPESRFVLHARTHGPATAVAPRIAQELRQRNGRLVASEVMTLDRYMERAVIAERIAARASIVLAVLQLFLALAGLSGLVAYMTALRRREIGIRSALGAERGHILALVTRQGVRLSVIGGAIGVAASLGVGQVIATTLPMTMAIEVRALAAAVILFGLVTGAALLLSARRALAVMPATALRVD
jgi:predicted permease